MGLHQSTSGEMQAFFFVTLLLARLANGQASCGPHKCCGEKVLGDSTYLLVDVNTEVSAYGCLNNCVYQLKGKPDSRYCFAKGDKHPKCIKDSLRMNQQLGPGEKLSSKNGKCTLTMQTDGRLVQRKGDEVQLIYNTTFGYEPEKDSNLVVYGPETKNATYFATTYDTGGVNLVLDDNCDLILYDANCEAIWKNGDKIQKTKRIAFGPNNLIIGGKLERDERISSTNRECILHMQRDGNLIITDNGEQKFESNTDVPNSHVLFKNNGVLEIISPNGTVVTTFGNEYDEAVKLIIAKEDDKCSARLFTATCKPAFVFPLDY